MKESKSKNILKKVIYWILCTLLIISLFIIIGGIGFFIINKTFHLSSIFGFMFGGIGSIIVLISIKKPLSLINPILKKENNDSVESTGVASTGYVIVGFSFILGGLLYSFTSRIEFLITSLWVPILLSWIGKYFVRKNNGN